MRDCERDDVEMMTAEDLRAEAMELFPGLVESMLGKILGMCKGSAALGRTGVSVDYYEGEEDVAQTVATILRDRGFKVVVSEYKLSGTLIVSF